MRIRTSRWAAATTVIAVTLSGCSFSLRATASRAGFVDSPFTHTLRFGAVRIEPPAIGQLPLVPMTRAQHIARHPLTWLGGASRNDLVAFGYGRVSAAANTVAGPTHFSHGRFAWVAVYRSSAAHLFIDGCLDGPDHRSGWHLVTGAPEPQHFYISVLIDATTGAQATSIPNFRDVCDHLVPNRTL